MSHDIMEAAAGFAALLSTVFLHFYLLFINISNISLTNTLATLYFCICHQIPVWLSRVVYAAENLLNALFTGNENNETMVNMQALQTGRSLFISPNTCNQYKC